MSQACFYNSLRGHYTDKIKAMDDTNPSQREKISTAYEAFLRASDRLGLFSSKETITHAERCLETLEELIPDIPTELLIAIAQNARKLGKAEQRITGRITTTLLLIIFECQRRDPQEMKENAKSILLAGECVASTQGDTSFPLPESGLGLSAILGLANFNPENVIPKAEP